MSSEISKECLVHRASEIIDVVPRVSRNDAGARARETNVDVENEAFNNVDKAPLFIVPYLVGKPEIAEISVSHSIERVAE